MSTGPESSPSSGHGTLRVSEGLAVHASDGVWGEVADIVVDPAARTVTHVVVQPHARHDEARLVAMRSVTGADTALVLSLSSAEIEAAPRVAVSAPHRIAAGSRARSMVTEDWSVGTVQPFGGSPAESTRTRVLRNAVLGRFSTFTPTSYDRIPPATAELDRTSVVVDRDGRRVGLVEGLIVDEHDAITHLIADRGRLGKHRHVAVTIDDVGLLSTDRVELTVDRDAVDLLPAEPRR